MQIADKQTDKTSLSGFCAEAVGLLCSGNISELASRFGYALAHGRESEVAIREDLATCLAELQATHLATSGAESPTVKYFQPNDSNLFALVECDVPTENGNAILVELIVTASESAKYVTLEQLSVVA
jgi:hypothetical protein